MAQYRWYSDKDNVNFSTEQRTYDLIKTLKLINSDGVDVDVNYIENHLDMIQYEFDDKRKLVKIVVNPNSLLTFKHESKIRQCDNSYGITKLLIQLVTGHNKLNPNAPTIDIKMVNESHCKSVIGTQLYTETHPVEGTQLYTETRPVEGDTAVSAGGSKYRRRKRMRKTRRGRTRKSKSKTKAKTHRRRRHSRVRKNKKYTSRRR
jgi:hypothetical protein